MQKPIIGITCRNETIDERLILKVNQSIIDKIIKNGGIPITLFTNDESLIKICNGFIIPGGNTWTKLDEQIIMYSIKNNKALLGICAGMQALGNINNFNDLKSDKTIKVKEITNVNHNIKNENRVHTVNIKDGILYDIIKKRNIWVNSRHNDTIVNNNLFKIEALSNDNVIEAISITDKILGIQWHPEDLDNEDSDKIFKFLIEQSNKIWYYVIEHTEKFSGAFLILRR